jgi:single-stranded-DNA-specific exonuclease
VNSISKKYNVFKEIPKDLVGVYNEYDELLAQLLYNRGLVERENIEKFLKPSYEDHIYDPFLIKDMDKACERILRAIEKKENIVIYGDYDCDGIPASTILNDFFEKIGYENHVVYIPHRHDEGFGLHKDAIDGFLDLEGKGKANLLITVDLGITDIEQVAHANSLGIDVIITDHHLPAQVGLPNAYAILNSKQEGDNYPDKMLCGSGVAFKLVQALIKKGNFKEIQAGWEKWLLDMVGLATLSDMVPLLDENRIFARFGMKVLRKTLRPGLLSLFRKMKMNPETLSEEDITFMITPRINAASRMADPRVAYDLLSTKDHKKGAEMANFLTSLNDERKIIVAHIIKEAKHTLSMREEKDIIVIGNPKWRVGVLGLVASKLSEEYKKPSFVWGSEEGSDIKGSCRSDGTCNLVELMTVAGDDTFSNFGGHAMAGGFSLTHEKVHFLESKLLNSHKKINTVREQEEKTTNSEKIDPNNGFIEAVLTIDDVNTRTHEAIEALSPFGVGNYRPVFLFKNLRIHEIKMFGKEKNHLELIFMNKKAKPVKAIAFFKNKDSFGLNLEKDITVDLVASIECSYFMNKKEIRLRIVDCILR